MLRYRIISFLAVILLLLSATTLYAARSSSQFLLRGGAADFPQPIEGAEALLIGVNVALEQYDPATLDARLSDLARRGVRYARQEFRWTDIEPSRGRYDWATSDRIFGATQRNGIQVLPVLVTAPLWARAETGSAEFPAKETMPPRDPADFAAFTKAFAGRYDVQILAYQIWDEPNLSAKWGDGLISPVGYLRLLRAARAAIQSVNPAARIVLAGLAPTVEQTDVNLSSHLYLRGIYEAGGRDAFDIVATKPYGFDLPPDDRRIDAGALNFSRAILLREEMVAHGDAAKAMWLTQWGWNAQLPDWRGDGSLWSGVSETDQARYTAQAIQRVAREWHWAGAMFLYTLQPNAATTDPLWGFALLDQEGKPRPVYEAFTNAVAAAATAPRAQWAAVGQGYKPNPRASFSEGWRFGELGADVPQREDAGVTVRFNGDALAMIVRRDDYRAYMFITVDGRPANLLPAEARGAYLILTSPDRLPHVDTIPVADALGPGEHVAEVKIDRGWNQWALIGWSSRAALNSELALADAALPVAAVVLLLSLAALAASWPRARWSEVLRRMLPRARSLTWQSLVAALLVWLTASLTWAQDAATAYHNLGTPAHVALTGFVSGVAFWSPVFVLSLLALATLFALVLLRLDVGLALLAFFIPFYLIPQRIFAKAFPMVELLTLMCAISWALRKIKDLRFEIGDSRFMRSGVSIANLRPARSIITVRVRSLISRLSLLDWGIGALVLVSALSATQADFKVEALRELRMVIVEPAILFLLLRSVKLDMGQVWRIADGFVLGAVVIALIGLVNYAQGNVFPADFGFARIRSVYGSPNNDALYLGRAFPLLLAMALFGRRTADARRVFNRRVLYAVGMIAVAVAMFLSASRGVLLFGAPAAIIVVCLAGGGRWRYLGVALLALAGIALIVLLSGVAAPLLEGTRLANALDLTRGTGFFRINLWESALMMWRDHPILGVGPDNFLYAYRGHYILPAAWQEPNLSHPHNIVLDVATRLGTLGLLAGAVSAMGIFRAAKRALAISRSSTSQPLAIGLVGLFVDVLAHGMVDHALFLVDLAFVFMLACGLLLQLKNRD